MAFTALSSGDDWYCVFGADNEYVTIKKVVLFALKDGIETIPLVDNGLGTPVDATSLKDFLDVTKDVSSIIIMASRGLPTPTGKIYREAVAKGAIPPK